MDAEKLVLTIEVVNEVDSGMIVMVFVFLLMLGILIATIVDHIRTVRKYRAACKDMIKVKNE